MKVILCNDRVYLGGVESLMVCLTGYFLKKGYDVTVMASPDDDQEFASAFGDKVHCIRARWPRKYYKGSIIRNIRNFIARKVYRCYAILWLRFRRYDVGIAFKEGVTTKDGLWVRAKKKYAWVHCDLSLFQGFTDKVFRSAQKARRCMQKYDNVVCVSETAEEGVVRTVGDPGNLCVRYNPIDWRKIIELSKEKCSYKRSESRPLIVASGRLVPIKNYVLLLEACKKICGKLDFDLWIIGNGSQKEELDSMIKRDRLECVRLLGFQKNPFNILKQADLFVSTSLSESYGLAVQEALILGVPVVAVKCPGIIESFDSRFGILLDNKVDELTNTIQFLLENTFERQKIKDQIKKYFRTDSLFEQRMEEICRLWENNV